MAALEIGAVRHPKQSRIAGVGQKRPIDMMARLLGVRYQYEETVVEAAAMRNPVSVTRQMLAALPPEPLSALRDAIIRLDIEQCYTTLERIAETDPELANALHIMVEDFDFGAIKELLMSDNA